MVAKSETPMDQTSVEIGVAGIAAAIGEPARDPTSSALGAYLL